jgi:hypothetical protein
MSSYQSLAYSANRKPKSSYESWVNLPSGVTYDGNTNGPVGIAHGPLWSTKTSITQSLSKKQSSFLAITAILLVIVAILLLLHHFGVFA